MITSLSATNVSFWCSLRKTAFQFGSLRNFEPSSPSAAGVSPDEIACAKDIPGVKAAAALAKRAARIRSRRLIREDWSGDFSSATIASRPENSISRNRSEERRVGKECRCRWQTLDRRREKLT